MLFFVFIILLTLGIIGVIVLDAWDHGFLHMVSSIITCLVSCAILISLIVFANNYIGVNATIAKNKQIYESLTYQYENAVFDEDDDVIGKKELYNQIQDWNADLAYYQNIQDNFWVGIYHPNVFDQFEFIEYK